MTVSPESLAHIYYWSKIIGEVGGASTVLITAVVAIFKYLKAVYKQRQQLNDTVTLLATNHVPHLQKALDEHGGMLVNITSDVRDIGTKMQGVEDRQEDLRRGVHTLGDSFLRHLEAASRETSKPVKKRTRK
jgi:preprotein translocase subunit SecD